MAGVKHYYVSQDNGTTRTDITVTVYALGATPGIITGVAAQGKLVGTATPATYSIGDVALASSYIWTVPGGVNIVSGQGTTALVVNFLDVASGTAAIGNLSVQAVSTAGGCAGAAKTLTLTKALPATVTALVMTDTAFPLVLSVTDISKYAGTSHVYTLTATSLTATSFRWALPAGTTQLSGGTTGVITVKFDGVVAPTTTLTVNVYGVTGVGESLAAKALVLKAALPLSPTALVMTDAAAPLVKIIDLSKYVGTSKVFTLTATVASTSTASSFDWTLPSGVNLVSGALTGSASPVITVNMAGVGLALGALTFKVTGRNGVGAALLSKDLIEKVALPLSPTALVLTDGNNSTAITDVSKYAGTTTAFTLTATVASTATSTSYLWSLPSGVTQLGGGTSNAITVNFAGVSTVIASLPISVSGVNGVGTALAAKTLALKTALASPVTVVMGSVKVCTAGETKTYTITAPVNAIIYSIVAPTGSVVTSASDNGNTGNTLTTSDLTFNVAYPSGLFGTANKLYVTSGNNITGTVAAKALTLIIGSTCGLKNVDSEVKALLSDYSVTVYPNPFNERFGIALQTQSDEMINVLVYDMLGKLLDKKQVLTSALDQFSLGENYASGDYLLVVAQGAQIKTFHIMKR